MNLKEEMEREIKNFEEMPEWLKIYKKNKCKYFLNHGNNQKYCIYCIPENMLREKLKYIQTVIEIIDKIK